MANTFAIPSSQNSNISRVITFTVILLIIGLLMLLPELGWAQTSGGLTKSQTTLEKLRDWLWLIIPVICLCIGGILGVAYSMDIIRKDTLYNWCIGVGFAGLIAGGIIELVF